ISSSQNNSEVLNIGDKAPFVTENEFDLSAMNNESKKDLPIAPTNDEYPVNEMEVSKGKRERTSDSEGRPPKAGSKGAFTKDIRLLMYGFGDEPIPATDSINVMEELVTDYITEM
ncbi:4131_t:CDS:2, partial [Racocetra fulgida]